jgi:hypothetical protein
MKQRYPNHGPQSQPQKSKRKPQLRSRSKRPPLSLEYLEKRCVPVVAYYAWDDSDGNNVWTDGNNWTSAQAPGTYPSNASAVAVDNISDPLILDTSLTIGTFQITNKAGGSASPFLELTNGTKLTVAGGTGAPSSLIGVNSTVQIDNPYGTEPATLTVPPNAIIMQLTFTSLSGVYYVPFFPEYGDGLDGGFGF